ncbi:Gfo/Idh/MocA family protein [Actinoplanes sp. N902-109]|uniref:Gfo/Idh/MocA family protein n=1 Tax=Actinoplanes sp. (strain N902-109) TaxID=649831 RepID=UPI0003295354|nr:oxidoreductase [Actinoplanes sp. N902-109]AGL17404.1 oxidoreductase domain-containing protein [Actinoplanes sp. N902-109]
MTTYATVGAGWRARMFWDITAELDGLDCVGTVVRSPRELPVPSYGSLAACVAQARPDFIVTAVSWDASPAVITEAVERGLPVLAETPPAPDAAGLSALWSAVGASGLVQVAEQYLLVPAHAARLAAVRAGVIGTPSQVQVSSTHMYHAVSLIRGFLGGVTDPVTVRASRTVAPLADPLTRDGWTDTAEPRPATTILATLDFGDGRSGLYDFTDNQWHNQLRFRRLLVRGSHGELRDDEVVRLTAPRTIVRSPLVRRQTGYDLDLDGFDTDTITLGDQVLFRNPYPGRRFNDEEIAIATLLEATAAWVRGAGPAPYPLAEGIRDHVIALAVEESADTDRPVTAEAHFLKNGSSAPN